MPSEDMAATRAKIGVLIKSQTMVKVVIESADSTGAAEELARLRAENIQLTRDHTSVSAN